MAHNNKNGIFKRNSPMSELVVVENERKKKRKKLKIPILFKL